MQAARELIKRSFEFKTYTPTDSAAWADAYAQFLQITAG
jgi:hypothetical protein